MLYWQSTEHDTCSLEETLALRSLLRGRTASQDDFPSPPARLHHLSPSKSSSRGAGVNVRGEEESAVAPRPELSTSSYDRPPSFDWARTSSPPPSYHRAIRLSSDDDECDFALSNKGKARRGQEHVVRVLLWSAVLVIAAAASGGSFIGIYHQVIEPAPALLFALGVCCITNAASLTILTIADWYHPRHTLARSSPPFDTKIKTVEKMVNKEGRETDVIWFTLGLDLVVLYLIVRMIYSDNWGEVVDRIGDYLSSPNLSTNIPQLLVITLIILVATLQSLGVMVESVLEAYTLWDTVQRRETFLEGEMTERSASGKVMTLVEFLEEV